MHLFEAKQLSLQLNWIICSYFGLRHQHYYIRIRKIREKHLYWIACLEQVNPWVAMGSSILKSENVHRTFWESAWKLRISVPNKGARNLS